MSEKIKFNILKYAGTPKPYDKGSHIFKKGDPGDSMFVVTHGEVEILSDGKVVDHLTDGEIFGEMALIDKAPRSASVTTLEESKILKIARTDFFQIIRDKPPLATKLLWSFLQVLSTRLRTTNEELSGFREGVEDLTEELFELEIPREEA